jgi:hypothetical protein
MLFGGTDSSYDVIREGEDTVLRVDYEKALEVPSLEYLKLYGLYQKVNG